jgi:hypothetical protein
MILKLDKKHLLNINIQLKSKLLNFHLSLSLSLINNNLIKRNDEITLASGTIVTVLEKFEDGWWRVEINGNIGLYPSNYLEDLNNKTTTTIINNESSQSISTTSSSGVNNNNNNKPQNTLFAAKTIEHLTNQNIVDENTSKGDSLSSNENDCEYVRVVYPYIAKTDNELTINPDEILRVVEDEINSSFDLINTWTKVVNSRGNIGLIPSNCVHPIVDTVNLMRKPVENCLFPNSIWYFGNISRQETNLLLNKYGKNGDYLVRDCERDVSVYSTLFSFSILFIIIIIIHRLVIFQFH